MCRGIGHLYKKRENRFVCCVCGKAAGWFTSLFMVPRIHISPIVFKKQDKAGVEL